MSKWNPTNYLQIKKKKKNSPSYSFFVNWVLLSLYLSCDKSFCRQKAIKSMALKKEIEKTKNRTFGLLGDVVIVSGAANNGNQSNCHAYHLDPVTLQNIHFFGLRSEDGFSNDEWVFAQFVEWLWIFCQSGRQCQWMNISSICINILHTSLSPTSPMLFYFSLKN